LQFGHVRREMLPECAQLGIFRKVPSDVTQHSWNIGKKLRVVFDPINIHEPAGGFEIALDTGQIEQTAKGRAVTNLHSQARKAIEKVLDQCNMPATIDTEC
jgi:hypothetical protein